MKSWILIAISIALVLSFALVYLLSPDHDDFLAQHNDDSFVTVAAFDVPLDGHRVLDILSTLYPLSYKSVSMDIDQIEIRVNKNLADGFLDYIRDSLQAELSFAREEKTRLNLNIRITRPVYYFVSGTFSIVRLFSDYDKLLDEHAAIKICAPLNYEFD